jgi:hypothetical protein
VLEDEGISPEDIFEKADVDVEGLESGDHDPEAIKFQLREGRDRLYEMNEYSGSARMTFVDRAYRNLLAKLLGEDEVPERDYWDTRLQKCTAKRREIREATEELESKIGERPRAGRQQF